MPLIDNQTGGFVPPSGNGSGYDPFDLDLVPATPPRAYPMVTRWVTETPWAITPERLAIIAELLKARLRGERPEWDRAQAAAPPVPPSNPGSVAVLPLFGVMAHRVAPIEEMSGATSTERFAGAFKQALADPSVSAIVLNIDSPGGSVDGTQELADLVYSGRGQKPIVAVANTWAASAAYWVASAADEVVVSPSGQVGSIGVYMMHTDMSRALDSQGLDVSFISAGQYKVEGNPAEPLSDETRAYLQGQVNKMYDLFTAAVARNRGVQRSVVLSDFGQGRMMLARDAVKAGLADRVDTLDAVVQRLRTRKSTPAPAAGQAPTRYDPLARVGECSYHGAACQGQAPICPKSTTHYHPAQSAADLELACDSATCLAGQLEHSARAEDDARRRRLRLRVAQSKP